MRVGVIGLGFMGATHVITYSKLPDVRVKAVAARDKRLLSGDFSTVGGNLGRPLPNVELSEAAKYQDWKELIADPELDAVDICLPTNLHAIVATAALAAGKHVLCEKPMALDGSQCEQMLAASQSAGRVLMIGHVLRFWPAYLQLLDLTRSGRYGPMRSAIFTRSCGIPDWSAWLTDDTRSGGAILDLLIHDLDQILLLFGMPSAVRAKALGNVDALTATFLYPNGPEVRLQGGWMAAGTPFSMGFQVRAERAQLELTGSGLTISQLSGEQETIDPGPTDPFAAQLAYFQQCCDLNREPDRCPPRESAAAVKLALLLKQSRSLDGELIECAL